MLRSTIFAAILLAAFQIVSIQGAHAEDVVEVPINEWFFCSGDFDQPLECGEPGFPHISVFNEDYEGIGLSCGVGEELSLFAITADVVFEGALDFSMDVQVERFSNHDLRDVAYLAPEVEGDASTFMKMRIADSLVTEIARGNTVNISIYQEGIGTIYENSFGLKNSARSIRSLRALCATL